MEANRVHADDNERDGQAPVGRFTVEARIEGVTEKFVGVLAVKLAQMGLTVRVKQVDITPKQGEL